MTKFRCKRFNLQVLVKELYEKADSKGSLAT